MNAWGEAYAGTRQNLAELDPVDFLSLGLIKDRHPPGVSADTYLAEVTEALYEKLRWLRAGETRQSVQRVRIRVYHTPEGESLIQRYENAIAQHYWIGSVSEDVVANLAGALAELWIRYGSRDKA